MRVRILRVTQVAAFAAATETQQGKRFPPPKKLELTLMLEKLLLRLRRLRDAPVQLLVLALEVPHRER